MIIAALIGIVLGIVSNMSLFIGAWWDLALWAAAGLIIGAFARGTRESVREGALYGILLTLSFLISGFQGASDKLPTFIVFSLFLSIIGAACGALASYIGHRLARAFKT